MKLLNFNLKNFRSKEWWLQELKDIRWTEILLLIALILCYFQVVHVKEVAQDPFSFCIVSQNGMEQTCKEFFNRKLNLENEYDFAFSNISFTETKG